MIHLDRITTASYWRADSKIPSDKMINSIKSLVSSGLIRIQKYTTYPFFPLRLGADPAEITNTPIIKSTYTCI